MVNEIAVRTEGLLRVESTIENASIQREWKAGHRRLQARIIAAFGADRAHGTGKQGLIRLMNAVIAFGLRRDGRIFADFLEAAGRELPARIAVDAGPINEKVAGNIRIETFFRICHGDRSMRETGCFDFLCSPSRHISKGVRRPPRVLYSVPWSCGRARIEPPLSVMP